MNVRMREKKTQQPKASSMIISEHELSHTAHRHCSFWTYMFELTSVISEVTVAGNR